MNWRLAIFISAFVLSGCGELLYERSFVDEMDRESDGFFVANQDFPVVPGDSGDAYRSRDEILNRTPASKGELERYQTNDVIERELLAREDTLSPHEQEKYHQVSKYLATPSEKIYYLKLPSRERDSYLTTRGISVPFHRGGSGLMSVGRERETARELVLGLRKDDVMRTWGRPHRVDIAGDPNNENERWSFYENGKIRLIYFEDGRVGGWSLD